ncbi:MAG TPA: gluconate 2-dehydrogenase subunit 3 family protein [Vicinamibacterales bacterium]
MARKGLSRRDVLRAGAAAATGTAVGGAVPLRAFVLPPDGPRALTREQYALLDELTEILIPADEHSGGARAAGVAAYIDGRLAEAFDRSELTRFVEGLRLVDTLATTRAGRRFLDLDPAGREAIVAELARDELRPETPGGRFFVDLKRRTVHAYYTSRIGIHDDMGYLGNTMQEEYSGIDVSRK